MKAIRFDQILMEEPDNKKALIQLGIVMEYSYGIVRTKEGLYFYEHEGYHYPLKPELFAIMIEQSYGIRLGMDEVNYCMSTIHGLVDVDSLNLWLNAGVDSDE